MPDTPSGVKSAPPADSLNGRLLPRHLEDLRRSGLSDATIAACHFYTLEAPGSVQQVLRWKHYGGELGACLAIPFTDADGRPAGYVRLKPDNPRKGKEGKPVKYEAPKGMPNLPYFPPGTLPALRDPSRPLVITEGEKKAAKADQEGFPSVGLTGVWSWQLRRERNPRGKPRGKRRLIPGLAALPWQGRTAFVCFDSDLADNPAVRLAEWHLANVLVHGGRNH
jgi:hypothetical protein